MNLLQKLHIVTYPIMQKIKMHPFNSHLYRGNLPPAIFNDFVSQDQIYLRSLAQGLEIIANGFTGNEKEKFKYFSMEIMQTEEKMLEKYVIRTPKLSVIRKETEMMYITKKYSDHILECAFAPIPVCIAAVLPCFEAYRQLGQMMATENLPASHPFKGWIKTYSSPSFLFATQEIVNIFCLHAANLDPYATQAIIKNYETSMNFELQFFNQVYNPLTQVSVPMLIAQRKEAQNYKLSFFHPVPIAATEKEVSAEYLTMKAE
ncbi:thiaminase II/PqqC family protein [Legionella septentrionalis]|uniref:Thiaminase-2/PQQC domain-containing protein n=1 Tax=Legionella septentrionalis TaxID=2498109 RepID=A0A3S0WT07_9GAMM|nr:hypothetical protein [Legionella septentrionalis]RUQ90791.1 hypothetical protein EKM59_01600 [Legionella septentrionalis]